MKTTAWILMSATLAILLAGCKTAAGPGPAGRPSEVIIKHCTGWGGYRAEAVRVAAEIKGEFDVNAKLVEGDPESFEVVVDGKTVFSKEKADRFPDAGEVVAEIRKGR